MLTLVLVLAIGALLVLTNLSDDYRQPNVLPAGETRMGLFANPSDWSFDAREAEESDPMNGQVWNLSFGWPLLWNQYVTLQGYGVVVAGWRFSAGRLAANMAM